jgi:hypothetical protein
MGAQPGVAIDGPVADLLSGRYSLIVASVEAD